ncbi:hypothetical protein RDABS01_039911 [Bienertia sinuspersici]
MLDLASCLGRKPQKDILENLPTKLPDNEPTMDDRCNKTPEQLGSTHRQIQAPSTVEQDNPDARTGVIEDILKRLESWDVGKVVLYGQAGVGKTWIAKEITKQAIWKNLFHVTIWVYKRQIQYSSVFHQISVQQNLVGSDLAGGDSDYHLGYDGVERDLIIKSLQQKLKGIKCLVIFDDYDNEDDDDDHYPLPELETMLIDADKSSKVLITTHKINDMMTACPYINGRVEAIEIKPLTLLESKDLLQRSWNSDHIQLVGDDDVEDIVKRCKCLPAAIVFTGHVLSYALKNAADDKYQRLAVIEAKKEMKDYWMLGCCSGFEKFRNNATIIRCLWLSVNYLKGHASMNYNKLILFWMLDGCFDNSSFSLNTAYAYGHKVLMDFLDTGLLGEREVGDVVLERGGLEFINYLFQTISDKFQWKKLCNFYDLSISGNVKRMKDSIGVFTKLGEGNIEKVNLVTLLLMGNNTSKVDQIKIDNPQVAESMRILFVSYVNPIISLHHLCPFISVVILKDCHSINYNNISDIANLKRLMALEISRCSSLKEIPEDFFTNFEHLESLNLSDIPIKYFPRLSFGLNNLHSLYLRRCTQLESFPDVDGLGELKVLDLSGCKFDSFVCYLEELPELRVLDLSDTNIDKCLDLGKLDKLRLLLLNDCPILTKLESVGALKELEVIEASGSHELDYFCEVNDHCLIHRLDLSYTKISKLPPFKNANNLVYLSLKGCWQLKELPPVEGAKNLRILDVSDAIQLEEINASFEEMKSLQELLMSNTNIKALPPLLGLGSLRKLMLQGCKALQSLPELYSLDNLRIVDIRGCISLKPVLETWRNNLVILPP